MITTAIIVTIIVLITRIPEIYHEKEGIYETIVFCVWFMIMMIIVLKITILIWDLEDRVLDTILKIIKEWWN